MPLIYKTKGEAKEYAYYGLNHYVGCDHGCTYCYMAKMAKRFHVDFAKPRLRIDDHDGLIDLIDDECDHLALIGVKKGGVKKRVQLCFSTDPYQSIDDGLRLTRSAIRMLRKHNIPFQVLTKAGFSASKDFDLYGPNDLFGVTLTSIRPIKQIEPHAASPSKRISALHKAHKRGIKTWVSLEPVIWPSETLEIIKRTHEFVDLYKVGKLNGRHPLNSFARDWGGFARDVVSLCDKLGVKYYLKSNLARLLEPGSYHNTDWREVE